MVIHDYDITTEPIVRMESFYGEKKRLVNKCLILFSRVIHDRLLSAFDCRVIAEISA